ncbi:hypothetical protein [Amycolatopsis sp. cmx-4-61]|uniref:hypothetical protein n=1 Tax=Amycolatopsis sp. cmx-4-61 TaxID=2790937 RepID=UPI00397A6B81
MWSAAGAVAGSSGAARPPTSRSRADHIPGDLILLESRRPDHESAALAAALLTGQPPKSG